MTSDAPLGPALWIEARVNGASKPVLVQMFERAIVTYNPANDPQNRVQIGLEGQIVYNGLLAMGATAATPVSQETATSGATATTVNGDNLGPEDYQTIFVDKNGNMHKFIYDNAPRSEGLLTLGLTLDTEEDKSDYAELLKRTGRTSDFTFKVIGYDDTTGEPPAGWLGWGFSVQNGPILEGICEFDRDRNLIFKYRNKAVFDQIVNDPRLARVYGTKLGILAIGGAMSQSTDVVDLSKFSQYIGVDETGLRIAHKLGLDVSGYPTGFKANPWSTFWSIQSP